MRKNQSNRLSNSHPIQKQNIHQKKRPTKIRKKKNGDQKQKQHKDDRTISNTNNDLKKDENEDLANEKFMAAHMLSEQAANFSKVYSTFCD